MTRMTPIRRSKSGGVRTESPAGSHCSSLHSSDSSDSWLPVPLRYLIRVLSAIRGLILVEELTMLETFQRLTINQFQAALCTLDLCVDRCPARMWNEPVFAWKFCQVAFHTLFFADYYLGPDEDSLRRQPFH